MLKKSYWIVAVLVSLCFVNTGFTQDASDDALAGTVDKVKVDAHYLLKENENV